MSFGLQAHEVYNFVTVDPDTQLAVVGAFKILDYLMSGRLTHTANILLTRWMTQPSKLEGVTTLDFELEDELKNHGSLSGTSTSAPDHQREFDNESCQ